jgi:pimeloyl-ACP methyl ester carboxylesterase
MFLKNNFLNLTNYSVLSFMKSINLILIHGFIIANLLTGCGHTNESQKTENTSTMDTTQTKEKNTSAFKADYANINGIKMYYEIHGTGQPLVLIHGGGSTLNTTFDKLLPLFAKTHQVIAVELQAHGRTSDRSTPESFEQDADDVAELLKQLNINNADILGFSNGGNTTMQIAIRHPEKVRKLIITSAMYKRSGIPAGFWEGMNHAQFGDMPQVYKDAFLKVNNNPAVLLNMFNRDVERMQGFKDWKEEAIRSIQVPALVVAADQDVATVEHTVELYRLLPKGRLAILPGTHGSFMGEAMTADQQNKMPEFFAAMVEEFLTTPAENK